MQTGGALSPLLGVPIQMRYGWRASFYVFALAGVVWAVIWFLWFRNTPREKRGITPSELNEIGAVAGRHEHGLPWRVAVRSGNFWAILLMALTYGYGSYFFIAWLHTYLVRANTSKKVSFFLRAPASTSGLLTRFALDDGHACGRGSINDPRQFEASGFIECSVIRLAP